MKNAMLLPLVLTALFANALGAQDRADSSSHTVQFITVESDVKLEVLDWGGTGRPLVFLAGMGNDAHNYNRFAHNSPRNTTSTASRGAASEHPVNPFLPIRTTQPTVWAMTCSL